MNIDRLIAKMALAIRAISRQLAASELSAEAVAAWQQEMATIITRYHLAALMAGQQNAVLGAAAREAVAELVAVQLQYLSRFAVQIVEDAVFDAGREKRAMSYAKAIKVPYWRGRTQMLPLPAMPAEGTECQTNCRCSWEIDVLDAEAGDYDCYWRRAAQDSCSTCVAREMAWSPFRVRGGEAQ